MGIAEAQYYEKRDFIRMYINADIRLQNPECTSIINGTAIDLSGSGIRFTTDDNIAEGQHLTFALSSKDGRVPPLEGMLSVTRVIRSNNINEVAAIFDQLS